MIHCKIEWDNGQVEIIAPSVPKIGEMIFVETMGHALVESLYQEPINLKNYIKVEYQETVIGKCTSTHRFEIKS